MTRGMIIAAAVACALPTGLLLLPPQPVAAPPALASVRPLQLQVGGDVSLPQRRLFIAAPSPQSEDNGPGAPPALVGIVGRLPEAVGMVRGPDGMLHNLSVGAALGGWRLIALGSDAALFARGEIRRRVSLPVADEADMAMDMRAS